MRKTSRQIKPYYLEPCADGEVYQEVFRLVPRTPINSPLESSVRQSSTSSDGQLSEQQLPQEFSVGCTISEQNDEESIKRKRKRTGTSSDMEENMEVKGLLEELEERGCKVLRAHLKKCAGCRDVIEDLDGVSDDDDECEEEDEEDISDVEEEGSINEDE